MKRFLLISLVAAFFAAHALADKPVTDGPEKLQGTWTAVGGERRGKAVPVEKVKELKLQLIISKDKFTLKTAKSPKGMEGTIKIDSTKSPKQIDMSSVETGAPVLGIYLLEGDTLKICSGPVRPKEFKTRPKSEERLHVYKREKQ